MFCLEYYAMDEIQKTCSLKVSLVIRFRILLYVAMLTRECFLKPQDSFRFIMISFRLRL